MILVIDCQQGVQTQTAECIVIGELLIRKRLVVALNKVDLITPEKLT
jgi:selenocysteine-specific elongation factor